MHITGWDGTSDVPERKQPTNIQRTDISELTAGGTVQKRQQCSGRLHHVDLSAKSAKL